MGLSSKRVLPLTLLIHVILVCIAVFLGHDNHNSAFYFKGGIDEIKRVESDSYEKSLAFLNRLVYMNGTTRQLKRRSDFSGANNDAQKNCLLSIIIISKNRASDNNVVRCLGYLLSRIMPNDDPDDKSYDRAADSDTISASKSTPAQDDDICITVMNNERPADQHVALHILKPLAKAGYISLVEGSQYSQKVLFRNVTKLVYNQGGISTAWVFDVPVLTDDDGWRYWEIFDYATALLYGHKETSRAKYTVILQDDAIISRSFVRDIWNAAETVDDEYVAVGNEDVGVEGLLNDWYAIKLFYSDRFSGWGRDDISLLISLAALIASIPTFLTLKAIKSDSYRFVPLRIPIFVYYTIVNVLLLLAISKQAIFPPFYSSSPRLFPLSNKMAVLVGQMYRQSYLASLAKGLLFHLAKAQASGISVICDLVIDTIATENNWKQYLLVPNVVQHIGRQSSDKSRNQGDLITYTSTSNSFPKLDETF